MAFQGLFYGLDLATLTTLKTNLVNGLSAIAVAGQSYSISGRNFTRANMAELAQLIQEVQAAIDRLQGTRQTNLYPDFSRTPYGYGSAPNSTSPNE